MDKRLKLLKNNYIGFTDPRRYYYSHKEAHIKDRMFLEFISPDEKVCATILELEDSQYAFYYDIGQEADFMFTAKICPSMIKAINEMLVSLTETKGFSMNELNSFNINIRRCK